MKFFCLFAVVYFFNNERSLFKTICSTNEQSHVLIVTLGLMDQTAVSEGEYPELEKEPYFLFQGIKMATSSLDVYCLDIY